MVGCGKKQILFFIQCLHLKGFAYFSLKLMDTYQQNEKLVVRNDFFTFSIPDN
jgi:hypothetical protein